MLIEAETLDRSIDSRHILWRLVNEFFADCSEQTADGSDYVFERVDKAFFQLEHVELWQVNRRFAVLGSKRRSKCVYFR